MALEFEDFSANPIENTEDITHMINDAGWVTLQDADTLARYHEYLQDPSKFDDLDGGPQGVYVNDNGIYHAVLMPSALDNAKRTGRIVTEFVKMDIDQVVDALPSSPFSKCKRIQVLLDLGAGNTQYATLKYTFYVSPTTKMALESGNDLLHHTALTMWGLTNSQRQFIRRYDLVEPDERRTKTRLWVSVMRAAVSSMQLTALDPKEWVDPKVVAIHRRQGEQACAAMITHILETRPTPV